MKFGKRLISMALALVMIFGLTVSASAAVSQNVTAKLSPDITVKLGNETQAMTDANGSPVYPVLYNGTTYLPIRAIANMMKIDVAWSPVDRTVMLIGSAYRTNLTASDKADSKTAPNAASRDITVQIDPSITVEYNGEAQKMTDANGNPVYPISYNDTTYLPVRAVSDMLEVDVTWNQNTRTVVLVRPIEPINDPSKYFDFGNGARAVVNFSEIQVKYSNDSFEFFGFDQIDDLRAALKEDGCSESLIDKAIEIFTDGGALIPSPKPAIDPFNNIQTSSGNGIETISDTCIAREWGKLDWSNASDGYVTVTVNKLAGPNTCINAYMRWRSNNERFNQNTEICRLGQGEYRIPLQGGNAAEYVVELRYATYACEHMCTADENAATNKFSGTSLIARFNAEVGNPGAAWLASTPHADYENAPKTQAKAKELTKNCKTDAEKVTAIFNWVADNIKYDKQLAITNRGIPSSKSCRSNPNGQHITLLPEYAKDYYDLDKILTSKSGICVHYAALTVGMLRSVGVQCRAIGGEAYANNEWGGHAWVEISPNVTGLNKTALGAGTGQDGWTRIDPTFAATGGATGRSIAMNDDNYKFQDFYF